MLVKKNPLYWEFTYLKYPFTPNLGPHPLIVQPVGAVKSLIFVKSNILDGTVFLHESFLSKNQIYKKNFKIILKKRLDDFPYFLSDPLREIIKIYTFSYAYSHRPFKTKIGLTKSAQETEHTPWSMLGFTGTFRQTYFCFLTALCQYAYENVFFLLFL